MNNTTWTRGVRKVQKENPKLEALCHTTMKLGFVGLTFLVLVAQAWAMVARDSKSMLPPDQDPWYQPPDGWEDAELGTIFRSRKVDINTLVKDNLKEAWQLLYRTTYVTDDQPTTSVTTVMVPHNADSDKLVVFADFIDANAPKCSPSYAWRNGLSEDISSVAEAANAMLYLQQGYTVTMPDKQGKINAFASGFIEGRQTLDGVRATLNFDKLKFSNNTKVAGTGYSGAALQAGWAAALRKTYAPELNMVGWTFGGTPTNLTSLLEVLNGGIFSGFLIGGVTGLYDSYDEVKDYFDRVLTKEAKEDLEYTRNHCLVENLLHFLFKDVYKYDFSNKGKDILYDDGLQKVLKTLTMGANPDYTPVDPVLMVHGTADEVIPYNEARKTYHAWCDNGANIKFVTYNSPFTGHMLTFVTTLVPMFMWVRDRLEGRPMQPKSGCSDHKNGEIGLNVNALGEDFRSYLEIIKGLLGEKIGPNDKYLIDNLQKHK